MASDNMEIAKNPASKVQKKRRSPNDYLAVGIHKIFVDLAKQQTRPKKKRTKKGADAKKPQERTPLELLEETKKILCKLTEFVVTNIAQSAYESAKERRRKTTMSSDIVVGKTIMPSDIVVAVNDKFLILSELCSKEVNDARRNLCNQLVDKIDTVVENIQDPDKSAPTICEENKLRIRSVYAEKVLKKAAPGLKVSRNAIVSMAVFIHYFARYLCAASMRDQISEGYTRLSRKHVQQAARGDVCLSPHFSRVRFLKGYQYPNAYGNINGGDQLKVSRR